MSQITQERLKELIAYDPEDGSFRWRVNRSGGVRAGDTAGSTNKRGLRYIDVEGRKYAAHRLAWLFMTGSWPTKLVDHRDRDFSNNAWTNLREATHAGNSQNRSIGRDNTSGIKGVSWSIAAGKWQAQIRANGKTIHLGTFAQKSDAAKAYALAAARHHGEFAAPLEDPRDARIAALEAALRKSVETIQVWHNMRMSGKQASEMWDIYWRNAPEMKQIRETLTASETDLCNCFIGKDNTGCPVHGDTAETTAEPGRECGACGHWIPEGGSNSCSLDHQPKGNDIE